MFASYDLRRLLGVVAFNIVIYYVYMYDNFKLCKLMCYLPK